MGCHHLFQKVFKQLFEGIIALPMTKVNSYFKNILNTG